VTDITFEVTALWHSENMYTVSHKNVPPNLRPYLCKMLTNYKNSLDGTLFYGKFNNNVIIRCPTTPELHGSQ